MTLRSLAPCLRAARDKHRFAAGKKHRNGKKHVWQQEKNALQREKAVSAAGKNASKKCRFAAGKIQSSRKNTLQQHKSTFAAEKMHFGGSGKKNRPRREKTRPRQEKNRPRQEKNQQQRKSSFEHGCLQTPDTQAVPQSESGGSPRFQTSNQLNTRSIDHIRLENLAGDANFS